MSKPPPRPQEYRPVNSTGRPYVSGPSGRRSSNDVDSGSGFRIFFVAVAISAILGLAVRIHFSPDRVKAIVMQAVAGQKFSLGFKSAELKLSRGSIPLFAIHLTEVELMPDASCDLEPSLKIAEIMVPFRFFELVQGRVAVGTVSGADLMVDLDNVKKRCDVTAATSSATVPTLHAAQAGAAERSISNADATAGEPIRWWAPEQFTAAEALIAGFQFSRVELVFEQKKKRVHLEGFSAHLVADERAIEIATDLRIPPEVSFGEALPPLAIEATVAADSAGVRVEAPLAEGNLELSATLRPLQDNALEIDGRVDVRNAPLSTLVPLLVKSGIATSRFKPQFLWLNCSAAIKGRFQGLFASSPLNLSQCAIEGGGSRVAVAAATRFPDGSWSPLAVQFQSLDVRRAFDTFSIEGPRGIASDFGRLTGVLEIKSRDEGAFDGLIEGVALRFSKRNVRSVQRINRIDLSGGLAGGRLTATIGRVELDGGRFDGSLSFEADRGLDDGQFKMKVSELVFHPAIQRLLVEGEIGELKGTGSGKFAAGGFRAIGGEWTVSEIRGRDFKAKDLRVKMDFDGNGADVHLRAPLLEVARESTFFQSARPVFFAHEFDDEWVSVRETSIEAFIPPEGGFQWERLQGALENGRIMLTSAGALSREREVSGWVSVDYPAAKKLKWTLGGGFPIFVLSPESKTLTDLLRRAQVDDAILGLPASVKAAGTNESTTTQALRALGERVIQKAKRIVPGAGATPASIEPVSAP